MITTAPCPSLLPTQIGDRLARRLLVIACAVVVAVVLLVTVGSSTSNRTGAADGRPSPPASVEVLAGLEP